MNSIAEYMKSKMDELNYNVEDVKQSLELMIEPTNLCNFRCEGCYNIETVSSANKMTWGYNDYKNIIDKIYNSGCKLELINVLGGDMSLGPFDTLISLLDENIKRGIKTNLVSNLLNFTTEQLSIIIDKVDFLKGKWNVGFDQYEIQGKLIGRDSETAKKLQDKIYITAELIRRKESKVIFRLDNFLRPSNYKLVSHFLTFCKEIGVYPFLEQVMYVGAGKDLQLTDEQTHEATMMIVEWYKNNGDPDFINKLVPPHFIYPCMDLGKSLYVRLNGEVCACPCAEHVIGNIYENDLDAILNNDIFIARKLIAMSSTPEILLDNGICKSCP